MSLEYHHHRLSLSSVFKLTSPDDAQIQCRVDTNLSVKFFSILASSVFSCTKSLMHIQHRIKCDISHRQFLRFLLPLSPLSSSLPSSSCQGASNFPQFNPTLYLSFRRSLILTLILSFLSYALLWFDGLDILGVSLAGQLLSSSHNKGRERLLCYGLFHGLSLSLPPKFS